MAFQFCVEAETIRAGLRNYNLRFLLLDVIGFDIDGSVFVTVLEPKSPGVLFSILGVFVCVRRGRNANS